MITVETAGDELIKGCDQNGERRKTRSSLPEVKTIIIIIIIIQYLQQ